MSYRLNKFVATAAGIGYWPMAPGTWAALASAVTWFVLCKFFPDNFYWQLIIILFTIVAGVYCSGKILNESDKDPNYIVIDEVAGMLVTILFISPTLLNFGIGLLLFRFFDILKPFGIKKMERIRKGWGIMLDDLLAGIYSTIILRLLIGMKIW